MSGATKLMTAGGGGVSLTPASSIASDVTVNVPSQNCTLDIQGPAFSAYPTSSQSFTSSVDTKVAFQAELFDTNSNFDSTTNYRFTPTVAGYYQVNATFTLQWTAAGGTFAKLFKNGSIYVWGQSAGNTTAYPTVTISTLVYLNGSTDYVELYGLQTSGSSQSTVNLPEYNRFSASLVRAA